MDNTSTMVRYVVCMNVKTYSLKTMDTISTFVRYVVCKNVKAYSSDSISTFIQH